MFQQPDEQPSVQSERKRSSKDQAISPKKKKCKLLEIDLPDAPLDGMYIIIYHSLDWYTQLYVKHVLSGYDKRTTLLKSYIST